MSDRHEKWVKVEPGTVIPADQPYRVEYPKGHGGDSIGVVAARDYLGNEMEWRVPSPAYSSCPRIWFVDSSWRPPPVLPTEPTWGIAVTEDSQYIGKWSPEKPEGWRPKGGSAEALFIDGEGNTLYAGTDDWINTSAVLDFIPLTDEQVARIEAAR